MIQILCITLLHDTDPMYNLSLTLTSPAMQCDYGSVYLPCGNPCPDGCPMNNYNMTEFCESMTCSEGCFCPEGYVRSSKISLYMFILTNIILFMVDLWFFSVSTLGKYLDSFQNI